MADLNDFATATGALIKDARWKRPIDTTTTDLDNYTAEGLYAVTRTGVANRPVGAAGQLEVAVVGTTITHRWMTLEAEPRIFVRRRADGVWGAWQVVQYVKASVGPGKDVNDLVASGVYPVTSVSVANLPDNQVGAITVTVTGQLVVQQATLLTGIWTRYKLGTTWYPWKSTIAAPTPAPASGRADVFQPERSAISSWAYTPTMETRLAVHIPSALSRDRLKVWNGDSNGALTESRDYGDTWATIHTFDTSFSWVRELGDGELIASVGVGTAPRELWRSTGYPTLGAGATWTKVLTAAAPSVTFSASYGFHQWENIVLMNEYGPKLGSGSTAEGQNARYSYMSTDYGKTWQTIFDLNAYVTSVQGRAVTTGIHVHGIAWDPYWDRLWITFGDDVSGTLYSDDLGATWQTADYGSTANAPHQNVAILPMPRCILFGTDGFPNGIQRINRSEGKKTSGAYTIDQAYTIPGESGVRTHLCHSLYRVQRPGGDGPAIAGFSAESNPGKSTVIASPDGYDWQLLWQDPEAQPAGKGIRSVIGPTMMGELIVKSDDTRVASRWSMWRGKVNVY